LIDDASNAVSADGERGDGNELRDDLGIVVGMRTRLRTTTEPRRRV
jgi:hypothetical protein